MKCDMNSWLVVGAGRCGLQLARAMDAADLRIAGVVDVSSSRLASVESFGLPAYSVDQNLPPAPQLLVAIPDDELVKSGVSGLAFSRQPLVALHTSGLHPGKILSRGVGRACCLGSLHPLVSFPDGAGPLVPLDGRLATVEGDDQAFRAAERLAHRLQMSCFHIKPELKPHYHAAAVLAANFCHVLVKEARSLMESVGMEQDRASEALAPLVRASVENALTTLGWEGLTGPLVRADLHTIHVHRQSLAPRTRAVYDAISLLALDALTQEGTLDPPQIAALRSALTENT
jgi:predicted short-subunit dehydrogenase-like oxidoreductase (DUF2520 family)